MDAREALGHPPPPMSGDTEVGGDRLTVSLLSSGDTALIQLDGQLDSATAAELVGVASSAVRTGSRHVVLDCGALRFCDSAGVAAFMTVHNDPGVESVTIARPSAMVQRLLQITGLEECFAIPRPGQA